MTKQKTAIHITKDASNTRIEGCEFVGFDNAIKNEGQDTRVIRSIFKTVKSIWIESTFKQIVVGVVIMIIGGYVLYFFGIN